ncbi:MAG: MATE family efflux transporter [Ruminococcaceae bacterium]|nr:MATE family efflux transporter [Oscillospiraceae bacterium]
MKLFSKKDNLMTEGSIAKKIILFAIPIFIGQLFQQLYNTVDSLIVGNLIGSSALADVSATGTLIFLVIGFFFGFSMGAGIVIAREIGAQNKENISKAVHTAVAMGLVFSAVITAVGVAFSPLMLRIMGTPQEVLPEAVLYLRIYFLGCSGLIMYNTFVGILQASGDSQHPLMYLITSSFLNVILDVVFIAVFKMGVDGAALATIISQFVSMLLSLRRLVKTDEMIRVSFKKIRFHKSTVKEIVHFGFPTAIQGSIIDLANILIQSYVNSFGKDAMAGVGAYSKLEGFAFLPVIAFSMAMSTYISQNLGAGKKDRVKKGMRFGLLSTAVSIEIIGVLVFILAPLLIEAFNSDPQVVEFGVTRARITSLFFFLLGFSNVTSAIMRGLGKPTAPMLTMLICWCAVRVIVFMTIGRVYHEFLLTCWIYPITWAMSSVVYLVLFRRYKKQGVY